MATQPNARKAVRNFVFIWIGITVLLGACTFAAIYTAYGLVETEITTVAVQPLDTTPVQVAAVQNLAATQAFPTRLPTEIPQATPTPITQPDVVAQVTEEPAVEPTDPPEPTPEPTILPVNDKEFQLGIQVQTSIDGQQETWMNEVEKLGMEWVKQQVRWENVEPEPGQYDWTQVDIGLDSAAERDIKVLLSIVTAPDWAREPGVDLSRHGPPADPQVYANFIAEILKRHPGKVHAIEVWNEMNLDREWTSTRGLTPANYVEMLRISYQTIKEIDPGIVVISGALSPTGLDNRTNAWDDFNYMDAMISAGMLNYTDCVGAHHNGINVSPNYSWDNVPNDPSATFRGPWETPHHSWSFRSTLQGYALRIQTAGGDQKLCVTEFGWPSTEDMSGSPAGFGFADDNTLEEQKEWTIAAINNMIEWDIVQIAILWNLNYGPSAGWDPNNDNVPYSIIGNNWNFRPVYGALQEWTAERNNEQ